MHANTYLDCRQLRLRVAGLFELTALKHLFNVLNLPMKMNM